MHNVHATWIIIIILKLLHIYSTNYNSRNLRSKSNLQKFYMYLMLYYTINATINSTQCYAIRNKIDTLYRTLYYVALGSKDNWFFGFNDRWNCL